MHSLFFLFCALVSVNIIECFKTVLRNDLTLNDNDVPILPIPDAAAKANKIQDIISLRWPNGKIPFFIDNHDYDYLVSGKLRAVMADIESLCCVEFEPITWEPNRTFDYLHFSNKKKERKCVHEAPYKAGEGTLVVLGYDCLMVYQIEHTLMHGLGFIDEVTRPKRTKNVMVHWNNMQPAYRPLYRLNPQSVAYESAPYDPRSIMEFHAYAFSKNGKPTLTPLHPGVEIVQSDRLTKLDEKKIQLFFKKECQKQEVEQLLDTCKDTLHAADEAGGKQPADEENNNAPDDTENAGITYPVPGEVEDVGITYPGPGDVEEGGITNPGPGDIGDSGNTKPDVGWDTYGPDDGAPGSVNSVIYRKSF